MTDYWIVELCGPSTLDGMLCTTPAYSHTVCIRHTGETFDLELEPRSTNKHGTPTFIAHLNRTEHTP